MSFRKPCHMPFRKLIPPFTLTESKVICRVIQRFETKLYSFLQFDKLVNLSNYKTQIDFFVKSFVAYLQMKLNKYVPQI